MMEILFQSKGKNQILSIGFNYQDSIRIQKTKRSCCGSFLSLSFFRFYDDSIFSSNDDFLAYRTEKSGFQNAGYFFQFMCHDSIIHISVSSQVKNIIPIVSDKYFAVPRSKLRDKSKVLYFFLGKMVSERRSFYRKWDVA